jgi:hypothetical protein
MPYDPNGPIGTHVRLLPDFYITRLLPPSDWAGTIVEERRSLMGQRTQFTVLLDEKFHVEAQDKHVDACEDEMEQYEQKNP